MKVGQLIVNVNSADAAALTAFYRDVVGLEMNEQVGGFKVGDGIFIVDGHSEIAGPTKEPARVLFNFFVDDIAAEHARIAAHGVKCIRSQEREPWGGVFSTFVDPDGNYFQIVEFRPE
jgi:predicted enzyme related to lactoylglutathione lyase